MDVKGDLSGIAMPGEVKPFITERHAKIGLPYSPKGYPTELLSLSQQEGVRMRATVSEFGPVLLARILGLNDTQKECWQLSLNSATIERWGLSILKILLKCFNILPLRVKRSCKRIWNCFPGFDRNKYSVK